MIFTKDNFIKFEILMWKSRNENHFGFFVFYIQNKTGDST